MILYNIFFSFFILLFAGNLAAQDIEARLSGATDAQGFTVKDNANDTLFTIRGDGKAGLGTGSPAFKLTLEKDGGILARGTKGFGATLPSITGPVMIWYPRKGAFRAGRALSGSWDDARIGLYSFASGNSSMASGLNSTALGYRTNAIGDYSTAMGYADSANGMYSTAMGRKTKASGNEATAMGYLSVASGGRSTAMGSRTTASGTMSTAMGNQTTANGYASTAMGYRTVASGYASNASGYETTASGGISTAIGEQTTASGDYSTAIGYADTASGNYSTALGYKTTASGISSTSMGIETTASGDHTTAIGSYVSTNGYRGTMYLGDASKTTIRKANANNRFYAVFSGGYRLYTNGSGSAPYCVYLDHNSNSWKTCSDSTKKENYRAANGEAVLRKFSAMRLGSWNYKGQDAGQYRHYGPMAQEWFTAFGRDGVGLIGNDTSLSSADVDGIAYIAIQALERRTAQLLKTTVELNQKTDELRAKSEDVEILREEVSRLKTRDRSTRKQVLVLETELSKMNDLKAEVSEIRSILRKFAGLKPETANTGELHPCMDRDAEDNTLLSRK